MNTPDKNQGATQKPKKKKNRFGRSKKARYETFANYPYSCRNCGFEYIGTSCPKCNRLKSD